MGMEPMELNDTELSDVVGGFEEIKAYKLDVGDCFQWGGSIYKLIKSYAAVVDEDIIEVDKFDGRGPNRYEYMGPDKYPFGLLRKNAEYIGMNRI